MIMTHRATLTLSGADGSAEGATSFPRPVNGLVRGVHIAYPAGANAATDVTLTSRNPAQTVVDATGNTSGWLYPTTTTDKLLYAVDEMIDVAGDDGNAGVIDITLLVEV